MRKWYLAVFSVLSLVTLSCTGCTPPSKPNGFIDTSGHIVIDLDKMAEKPISVGDFNEGLAPVKYSDKWGCLNKTGALAFTLPCNHISPYSEGLAAYSTGYGADEKWGYIDKNGKTVIKPSFGAAKTFSQGLAPVKLAKGSNATKDGKDSKNDKDNKAGKNSASWVYIDRSGKQVFAETYEEAQPFVQGLAVVKYEGHAGAINGNGNMVIPAKYDVVYNADNGKVVAAQGDGLSGQKPDQILDCLEQSGQLSLTKQIHGITLKNLKPLLWVKSNSDTNNGADNLIRPLSPFASPGFSESKSISQVKDKFSIDQQFSAKAFQGSYDYIFPVSENYFVAYSDDNGGKMDYRGGKPEEGDGIWNNTAFRFYDAAPFHSGMGLVQETKGGPYGYINKSGQYAFKTTFEHARSFSDGLALVGLSAENKTEN